MTAAKNARLEPIERHWLEQLDRYFHRLRAKTRSTKAKPLGRVIIVWYVTEWNEDRSPRELECQLVSSGYESAAVAAHELREQRGINSDTLIDAGTFVKLPPSKRIRTQASFARIWRAALQLDSFARLETATPFFAVHQERDNRVELALEMKNPSGRAPDVGKARAPSQGEAQVDAAWEHIDAWVRRKHLGHSEHEARDRGRPSLCLRPGTSLERIRTFETKYGLELPAELKRSMLHHDGQDIGSYSIGLVGSWTLLNIDSIGFQLDKWRYTHIANKSRIVASASASVKPVFRSPKWIPFVVGELADAGVFDAYCIDLDPRDPARSGQVIRWWVNKNERKAVAGSVAEFLSVVADRLKAGKDAFALGGSGCHRSFKGLWNLRKAPI